MLEARHTSMVERVRVKKRDGGVVFWARNRQREVVRMVRVRVLATVCLLVLQRRWRTDRTAQVHTKTRRAHPSFHARSTRSSARTRLGSRVTVRPVKERTERKRRISAGGWVDGMEYGWVEGRGDEECMPRASSCGSGILSVAVIVCMQSGCARCARCR